ncbi:hypothetical protein BpHYR1_035445 [Brachionus plicatilis]|uniref:Uncharacterized protein n=1 Tax=Brachionus plicatilis TaxID=10195 RepID=A0A3M7SRP4_BRAPC|nr:hypothetical protein BpHYR1_035445 [Brachionus plicatilis]
MLNKHPLVYSLIKEQKRTENKLASLKTRPKYLLLDERIQNIIKEYDSSDKEKTLIRLSIFNWHLAIFNLANLIKIKISAISIIAILIRSPFFEAWFDIIVKCWVAQITIAISVDQIKLHFEQNRLSRVRKAIQSIK